MSADMWRVPASKVKKGGGGSVIQDNGMLRHAVTASSGNYLFSEVGAGVMPLALIGMWHEIGPWLEKNGNRGIENLIGDLPDIHMGMCYYTPGQRYKGLFPLHDSAAALAKGAIGLGGAFVPDPTPGVTTVSEIIAGTGKGASTATKMAKTIFGGKKKSSKPTLNTHPLYFLFTYLPSIRNQKLVRLGSGTVKFQDIKLTVIGAMVRDSA
ncbi:MAG TPA: hypothetical protein VFJ13_01850 [Paracoccaceae bacterium]|nr:hypothetical protein [Paracoccaceae bacterium]